MYDVFISYSRKDSDRVNQFVDILVNKGYSVWIDRDGIESGDQFKLIIVKAIEESKTVLFFSSEASNASTWTAKEIGIANARSKPIIPIKLDNSNYNRQVEFDLINNDFVDFSDSRANEAAMKKLLKSIARKCREESQEADEPVSPFSSNGNTRGSSKLVWIILSVLIIFFIIGAIILNRTNSHDSNVEANNTETVNSEQETTIDLKTENVSPMDNSQNSNGEIKNTEATNPKPDTKKEFKTGYDLFTGNGVDMDYEDAAKHFKIAADAGHSEAQYILGRMYYHGIVTHDYSKAVKYFKMSAAQKNASAAYYLSKCYISGLGAPQNTAKAIDYLKQSASLGGFQARADLCSLYLNGYSVERNLALAKHYYNMAKNSESFNLSTLPGVDQDVYYEMAQKSLEDCGKEIKILENRKEEMNGS